MANTKISGLTSGNPALSSDLIPIDRSGSNFNLTAGSIASLSGGAFVTYIDTVAQFGVIPDCKWVLDATFSTSSTSCGSGAVPAGTCVTISATDPLFACPGGVFPCTSGGDVGKVAFGTVGCSNANPGACFNTLTDATITKVWDSTHAQVSKAVSHNSSADGNNFAWGSSGNGAKLQSATSYMVANPGTAIALPCGISGGSGSTGGAGAIMFDSFPFIAGTHTSPIGIIGCPGVGTILIPSTANFNNSFISSSFEIGVFATEIGSQDQFRDLFFWGLGADTNSAPTAHTVLSFSGAALTNVYLQGWLHNVTNSTVIKGLVCTNNCTLINSGSYVGGNFPCFLGSGFFSSTMTGGVCGGSNSVGITITGGSVPGASVYITGAYLYLNTISGYGVFSNAANPVVIEACNIAGISIASGSGPVVLKGNYIDYFFGAAPNMILNAGGTVTIEGNTFHPVGTPLLNQSSGTLIDNCGNVGMSGSVTVSGGIITGPCSNLGGNPWGTVTNCTSSASPAACGSAAQGSVVVAAGATTVVVDTTAVTANSQIFVQFDATLGTKLSVTCNTNALNPAVTSRTGGTSFTITVPSMPSVNPACFNYFIVN